MDNRPCQSAVAIDHQVHVGFHVGEHAAHHVALARQRHAMHLRAGGLGDGIRLIMRGVVEHMHLRVRQAGAKIGHHLGDGRRFVAARYQHGNARGGQEGH